MRADAARNLELLLSTGARMLADDASASITAIAAQAGVDRATDEGLLRSDLPPGWVSALLAPLMRHAAENLPDLSPAQAADVVVDTLLPGVGAPLLAAR